MYRRYRMDYMKFVNYHRDTNADITIGAIPYGADRAKDFGLMKIDEKRRVKVGARARGHACMHACMHRWMLGHLPAARSCSWVRLWGFRTLGRGLRMAHMGMHACMWSSCGKPHVLFSRATTAEAWVARRAAGSTCRWGGGGALGPC